MKENVIDTANANCLLAYYDRDARMTGVAFRQVENSIP